MTTSTAPSTPIHLTGVLGPVRSRVVTGEPTWVGADEIGAVTVALSADRAQSSREVDLTDSASAQAALAELLG